MRLTAQKPIFHQGSLLKPGTSFECPDREVPHHLNGGRATLCQEYPPEPEPEPAPEPEPEPAPQPGEKPKPKKRGRPPGKKAPQAAPRNSKSE